MADEHKFPPEPEPRRRMPAGQALAVVLVALLVGALLNADRIDQTARTQPFGWQRTWAVRITGPLQSFSDVTRLNRPRKWLADLAGKEIQESPAPVDTETVVTVPPTTPQEASTTTTTTAPPDFRDPPPEEPLKILVSGDSLLGWIGPALVRDMEGMPIEVIEDWKVASGLARPDYFNWPARLEEDMEKHDPEVVVIGFGGNDAQDMTTSEGRVSLGTPEWRAEYQRRVAQVLEILEGEDRTVYWVGLPVTSVGNIEQARPDMTEAVKTEISARPWAHFVDTVPVLTPGGEYTAYLPTEDGGSVKVREDDGVHPNVEGVKRMTAPVIAALVEERDLS